MTSCFQGVFRVCVCVYVCGCLLKSTAFDKDKLHYCTVFGNIHACTCEIHIKLCITNFRVSTVSAPVAAVDLTTV